MEEIYEIIMDIIDVILIIICFIIWFAFALFIMPLHWIEVAIFGSFNVTKAAASAFTWIAYNWPMATNNGKAVMIEVGNAIEEQIRF